MGKSRFPIWPHSASILTTSTGAADHLALGQKAAQQGGHPVENPECTGK